MMHFFDHTFYKDNRGRVQVIKKIDRFNDAQKYVHLFVMPDCKIMIVTCKELEHWIAAGIMFEFEPPVERTNEVWKEQALDSEWYKTRKLVTKV
jgi:hypothetical protein